MINKIKQFFEEKIQYSDETNSEEKSSKRIPIATCALLLEMAHADSDFSDIEEQKIISILQNEFDLSSQDAKDLLSLSDLERKESVDLWQFSNLINSHYSDSEKKKVLETLWRVVYADGKVDKYEDHLMRKLSFLLNIQHKQMIEAKLNARDTK